MPHVLADKVIITGASTGIGAATARSVHAMLPNIRNQKIEDTSVTSLISGFVGK